MILVWCPSPQLGLLHVWLGFLVGFLKTFICHDCILGRPHPRYWPSALAVLQAGKNWSHPWNILNIKLISKYPNIYLIRRIIWTRVTIMRKTREWFPRRFFICRVICQKRFDWSKWHRSQNAEGTLPLARLSKQSTGRVGQNDNDSTVE